MAHTKKGDLQPVFRLWLESESKDVVIDQVDAMLLRRVNEEGSLSAAAKKVGLSYRAAWGRIKRLERMLGKPMVIMTTGGRGGGGSRLTEDGLRLLSEFRKLRKHLFSALDEKDFWAQAARRLSARNLIPARVAAVELGSVVSKIKLEVNEPFTLYSIITNDAVNDLQLKVGDPVYAVIKATDVIVAKDAEKPGSQNQK
jgi:molybdate transport system regulatory protein